MTSPTYTDPATGRPYTVDPETGTTRWVDEAPPPPPPVGGPAASGTAGKPGAPGRRPKTVAGIVGLIVATIGLLLSWVPIVNNVAFVFALISGILGIVGLVATRAAGRRSGRWLATTTLVLTVLTVAVVLATQALYGKAIDSVTQSLKSVAPVAPAGDAEAGDTPGAKTKDVGKFGSTAQFEDGSTLTCAKPVRFTREEYAAGGEGKKVFLKSKCTFTNRSGKAFKPSGTTGSMSADGAEGESVYQEGLDAPDNPVLTGKSVTWWMGYGVDSAKDVQLTVSLGFLSYDDITFTS